MKIGDSPPVSTAQIRGLSMPGSLDNELNAAGDLGLMTGQLLKARIAAIAPDGKVLLDIGGRMVAARSTAVLEQGQEVWLEVRQTGITPWFSLAGQKGAAQELLKQLLSDPKTLTAAFQGISLLAAEGTTIPAGGDLAAIEQFFKHFAQNALTETASPDKLVRTMLWLKGDAQAGAGQQTEGLASLAADLKSLAATLLLPGDEGRGLTRNGIDHLVRLVESLRAFNAEPLPGGQSFANIFPCYFMQGAGWGQWMISVDEEQGADQRKKSRRIRLDFFLHLSSLGDVLVRAALVCDTLAIEFLLADEDVRGHVAAMLPELTKCLAGIGITAGLSCNIISSNLPHEIRNALQERLGLKTSYSIIDITA